MREPVMAITDGGNVVERLPFSQCPTFMLKASALGKTGQVPSEDGDYDNGAFNRQYAAILLRERGG